MRNERKTIQVKLELSFNQIYPKPNIFLYQFCTDWFYHRSVVLLQTLLSFIRVFTLDTQKLNNTSKPFHEKLTPSRFWNTKLLLSRRGRAAIVIVRARFRRWVPLEVHGLFFWGGGRAKGGKQGANTLDHLSWCGASGCIGGLSALEEYKVRHCFHLHLFPVLFVTCFKIFCRSVSPLLRYFRLIIICKITMFIWISIYIRQFTWQIYK